MSGASVPETTAKAVITAKPTAKTAASHKTSVRYRCEVDRVRLWTGRHGDVSGVLRGTGELVGKTSFTVFPVGKIQRLHHLTVRLGVAVVKGGFDARALIQALQR